MGNELFLQHFRAPKNVGLLDQNDPQVKTVLVGSPQQGEWLQLQIKVDPENQTIIQARYKVYGPPALIAASSLLSERLCGLVLSEIGMLGARDIAETLELPQEKYHCALLLEEALRKLSY